MMNTCVTCANPQSQRLDDMSLLTRYRPPLPERIWRGQLADLVASWHPGARTTRETNQRMA